MIRVFVDIDETALHVPEGKNAKASSVMFKKVFGVDAHEEMVDNFGKTEMGIIQEVRAFTPHVFRDFGENRWQQAIHLIEILST